MVRFTNCTWKRKVGNSRNRFCTKLFATEQLGFRKLFKSPITSLNWEIETYAYDIQRLGNQLGKTDAKLLPVFVRNLSTKLKAFTISKNPRTLQEAIDAATLWQSVLAIDDQGSVPEIPTKATNELLKAVELLKQQADDMKKHRDDVTQMTAHVNAMDPPRFSRPMSRPQWTPSSNNYGNRSFQSTPRPHQSTPRRNLTCFSCGRPGHFAAQCRNPRRPRYQQHNNVSGSSINVNCYNCGKQGHTANRCRSNSNNRATSGGQYHREN